MESSQTTRSFYKIYNGSSVRKATKKLGISESVLRMRLTGEVKIDCGYCPTPVFSCQDGTEMVKWMSEMSKRGMTLGPGDFLDFVQGIIKHEQRKTDFLYNRRSYIWNYSFMARNSHLIKNDKNRLSKIQEQW